MVGTSWHAVVGGEGAPDLTESLLNLSINSAALAGFSFLFFRDLQGAEKDRKVVDREELLGRLLVCLTHAFLHIYRALSGASAPRKLQHKWHVL